MKDTTITCKFCGRKIGIITWGVYRKIVVDAEAVMVAADPEGEEFVRIDGSKLLGKEVDPYEHTGAAEPAYRVHRKNCYRSVYR